MESTINNSSNETEANLTRQSVIINGMFINQNNTLLSIATDKGYKIYESYNFIRVSEEDDYQDLIGSLKIALTFYESQLVFFVGKEDNTTFLSNHLIIWDDIKKMKIGVIMLKENILDVNVKKEGIYILVRNKILVFGLKKLNYLYSIQDVDHIKSNPMYISRNSNPVVIATIPSTRPNQLKITKFNLSFSNEIESRAHFVITTHFQSIYKMNISKKGDYGIVIGHPENKIHVYSLLDFQLKFCIETELHDENIMNIKFSKKQKFFSILYKDLNLEIFSLPIEKKNKTILCSCESKYLLPIDLQESQLSPTISQDKKGLKRFFSGAFSKIKQIFNKKQKWFSRYKYDPFNLNESDQSPKNSLPIKQQGVSGFSYQENVKIIIQFEKVNEIVRFI